MDELYYIQNVGHVGNCILWWRVNGCGYTCNLDQAWKVSKEAAINICKVRPKEDIMYEVSYIDSIASRHVDCQLINTISLYSELSK